MTNSLDHLRHNARTALQDGDVDLITRARNELLRWHEAHHGPNAPLDQPVPKYRALGTVYCTGCQVWPVIVALNDALRVKGAIPMANEPTPPAVPRFDHSPAAVVVELPAHLEGRVNPDDVQQLVYTAAQALADGVPLRVLRRRLNPIYAHEQEG